MGKQAGGKKNPPSFKRGSVKLYYERENLSEPSSQECFSACSVAYLFSSSAFSVSNETIVLPAYAENTSEMHQCSQIEQMRYSQRLRKTAKRKSRLVALLCGGWILAIRLVSCLSAHNF